MAEKLRFLVFVLAIIVIFGSIWFFWSNPINQEYMQTENQQRGQPLTLKDKVFKYLGFWRKASDSAQSREFELFPGVLNEIKPSPTSDVSPIPLPYKSETPTPLPVQAPAQTSYQRPQPSPSPSYNIPSSYNSSNNSDLPLIPPGF